MNKLTKIVATVSDKTATKELLQEMIDAGMNAVRLNTAHQTTAESLKVIKMIREVDETIPVMLDTKGPEVRTSALGEPVKVVENELIRICSNAETPCAEGVISVNFCRFGKEVPVDSTIMIDDGDVSLTVIKKENEELICRVNNSGTIGLRKSVNVPGVAIDVPGLSNKDIDFIQFAAENDVDFIAHSFVRNQDDVIVIRKLLDSRNSRCKIIAKIENQEGVDNIDSILDHVFGIMIARGDLGIEIPQARIPHIQKHLIQKAVIKRKAVIVATQMLHTMIKNPRPTRAEVSDVANAIYDGTDAVMLSGETAYGNYPIEAIKTMAEIAAEVDSVKPPMRNIPKCVVISPVAAHLTRSAVKASSQLNASAIIADSKSGRTIRALAAYRPNKPVFAFCYDKITMRQIGLCHGVSAYYMPPRDNTDQFLIASIKQLTDEKQFSKEDLVVILAGNYGSDSGASFIEICPAKQFLKRGITDK